MSKGRVEAFSDGVFAIAITLLVLTIGQPQRFDDLAAELLRQWPGYAAYLVSFSVIGIMWFNHHVVFGHLARIDRTFLYLNLLLLMTIAFLPYPTGVLGEALRHGEGTRVAAVAYSIVMTLNGLSWAALWLYASGRRRLLAESFPEEQRRITTVLFVAGSLVYVVAIGIALVNAYACLTFHGALAVYYAIDPISRGLRRERS
ncbi:MAG: potassium channel family protein [Chloroflexota bacterium]|nr:potassium channel family protein [Chloroflexota bacterium]